MTMLDLLSSEGLADWCYCDICKVVTKISLATEGAALLESPSSVVHKYIMELCLKLKAPGLLLWQSAISKTRLVESPVVVH